MLTLAKVFTWQIDLSLASSLVPVDIPWCHVVALCEKSVLPAYRSLKGVLEDDIDHVSKLLSGLDPLVDESEDHSRTECAVLGEPPGSPSIEPVFAPQGRHSSDPVNPEWRKRKRRRSSTLVSNASWSISDMIHPHVFSTDSKDPSSSVLRTLSLLPSSLPLVHYNPKRPPAGCHTKTLLSMHV